jgi:hypothetical protein
VRLNEVYHAHKDKLPILMIYIREAHASNGLQSKRNIIDDVIYSEPTTLDERATVAAACQIALKIDLPMYLDSMDNDVEDKYVSLPIRLFVVDADGKVTYTGDPGPIGYDLNGWEQAIIEQAG